MPLTSDNVDYGLGRRLPAGVNPTLDRELPLYTTGEQSGGFADFFFYDDLWHDGKARVVTTRCGYYTAEAVGRLLDHRLRFTV